MKIQERRGSAGGGAGVPLEIPGLVVLCRGWCGLEGTDQVPTGQPLSLPSFPFLPHRNISSFLPHSMPFFMHPCIHTFFLTPRIDVPSGKNSTQLSRPPAEVTASGKPTRPELFCPSYCTCCTLVLLSYRCSLGNLVCLQNHQWSFESTDFEAGYPESASL